MSALSCYDGHMAKKQNVLIIPDVQLPYHDPTALRKIIKVAEDHQPDRIVQIGDLIDLPMVSRWTKGGAGEYALTLQEHITRTKDEFFSPLRKVAPQATVEWLSGNHDERITDYISKYGYPLKALSALSMENLFELNKFDISYVKGPHRIASNVYALHGHECGGYTSTLNLWDQKFQKRYGSQFSYVFGHTHQPGIISRASGWGGDVTPRFTMNVGSIMDPTQVTYVKDGSVNWTMSFAWIEDDGKRTWPELVLMTDRLFRFRGQRY